MVKNRVLACYTSVTWGCFALSTFTTVPTLWTEHLVQIICVALDSQLCRWWNSWFVLEIMDLSSVKQEKLYLNALLPSVPSSLNLQFIALVVEEHCISWQAGSGSIRVFILQKERGKNYFKFREQMFLGLFNYFNYLFFINRYENKDMRHNLTIQMSCNDQISVVTQHRFVSLQGCHQILSIVYYSHTIQYIHPIPCLPEVSLKLEDKEWYQHSNESDGKEL